MAGQERGYLCLTRRAGQAVLIGDDIRLVVTKIGGGQVKLAFDAPKDIKVLREELTAGAEPLAGVSRRE